MLCEQALQLVPARAAVPAELRRVLAPGGRIASSPLAEGYAAGVDGLRGNADIVTFDVGDGHVVISATDLNFRTWPRVAWTVIANAIYHGPSTEVAAATARSASR